MNKKIAYILGASLIIEALKYHPHCLKEIWLAEKIKKNASYEELLNLAKDHQVPIFTNQKGISGVSVKENCFAVGLCYPFTSELNRDKIHVILSNFKDEGNLGTCLRTMVSFNFEDVAIIGNNINLFEDKCVRASMGAIFHCRIAYFSSLEAYLAKYKKNLYYLTNTKGYEISEVKLDSKVAILLKGSVDDNLLESGKPLYVFGQNLSMPVKTALLFYNFYKK